MEGSLIESSFWNFDALFQPQDHPARELADTFYLKSKAPLPADKRLIQRVKKAHEEGWLYPWDPKEASRAVLRTHTTALSARYVASTKDRKPRKYFAIGRVFRNEATDYKHLAEFHQVEGIIVWEGAKFTDLLGILKEFYSKLGFEKIRFRPSFFPYTEPSLEIEVYFEKRKQWMELGGAGIFRPEVSMPLAGVYPVLAWGLSLERPLMLSMGIEDIRTPYKNDLEFLKSARVQL
jgi:phenylalanyl-tRNA synthetase alpha chain